MTLKNGEAMSLTNIYCSIPDEQKRQNTIV